MMTSQIKCEILYILYRKSKQLRVMGLIANNATELDETTNVTEVNILMCYRYNIKNIARCTYLCKMHLMTPGSYREE